MVIIPLSGTYLINTVDHGGFELALQNPPGFSVPYFNSDQLIKLEVFFAHDGSDQPPDFNCFSIYNHSGLGFRYFPPGPIYPLSVVGYLPIAKSDKTAMASMDLCYEMSQIFLDWMLSCHNRRY